jgi:hypothetical protein
VHHGGAAWKFAQSNVIVLLPEGAYDHLAEVRTTTCTKI